MARRAGWDIGWVDSRGRVGTSGEAQVNAIYFIYFSWQFNCKCSFINCFFEDCFVVVVGKLFDDGSVSAGFLLVFCSSFLSLDEYFLIVCCS